MDYSLLCVNLQRGDLHFEGLFLAQKTKQNIAGQVSTLEKKVKTIKEGNCKQSRRSISAANNVPRIIVGPAEYLTKTFNVIILRGQRKKMWVVGGGNR